jgi:hypothetical protein
MSELTTFDHMTIEAIEVACQSAFEECESVFRAIDSKKNQLEIFGRLLTAAKKKVAHGEWENWLTDTFHGRLPFRTAQRWMATAKAPEVALLKPDKADHVPRAERKTGRVKVEQAANQSAGVTEKGDTRPVDDDPNPAPKTNTKHSPANAKAKEADRLVPAAVTPVFVDEPKQWPDVSLEDLITGVIRKLEHDKQKKAAAKTLRKLADSLDPPTIGAPSIEAVQEWAQERGIRDFDADKFFAHYALAGWKYGKAKTPIKDWKLAAINAYASGKGWAVDGANRLPF